MTNYYRITAYHPEENISAIFDCYGMFEKKWQFSSFLVKNGFKVLEVGDGDTFGDGNLSRAEPNPDKLILRACMKGRPESMVCLINGRRQRTLQVANKLYIPDKEN